MQCSGVVVIDVVPVEVTEVVWVVVGLNVVGVVVADVVTDVVTEVVCVVELHRRNTARGRGKGGRGMGAYDRCF